jgi:anaerobic selenocysteine-containing dehydrogenase
MLSRRDFLKISGLTTIAAASGFGAGKLLGGSENISLKVQAFLPDISQHRN